MRVSGRVRSLLANKVDKSPSTSPKRHDTSMEWARIKANELGFSVPSRFRIALPTKVTNAEVDMDMEYSRDVDVPSTYSDFSGLRFPTLDTSQNTNYWNDVGLNRILARSFPLKLPTHRKIDPAMREYMHFLHNLDPARFTIRRIGERYGFKDTTVVKVVKEFGLIKFIKYNSLCKLEDRRIPLTEFIMQSKEASFKAKEGYIHVGNEVEDDDHEFKGNKDSLDWVYRQSIQVESLSAFPLASTRDAMPKRVDVDMTVSNTKNVKVINWIDPTDKVVF